MQNTVSVSESVQNIQNVIPSFDIAALEKRAAEIAVALAAVPAEVRDLYDVVKSHKWGVEYYDKDYKCFGEREDIRNNILVDVILADVSDRQPVLEALYSLGYANWDTYAEQHTNPLHIFVIKSHPDVRVFQTQFNMYYDSINEPLRLFSANYDSTKQVTMLSHYDRNQM